MYRLTLDLDQDLDLDLKSDLDLDLNSDLGLDLHLEFNLHLEFKYEPKPDNLEPQPKFHFCAWLGVTLNSSPNLDFSSQTCA